MAVLTAALYGLCVVAPSVSFAFGDGSQAAHCLTDNHGLSVISVQTDQDHRSTQLHQHQTFDSQAADESPNTHPDEHPINGQCCGLFCLSALPTLGIVVLAPPMLHSALNMTLPDVVRGQISLSFLRPPISSSSAALS